MIAAVVSDDPAIVPTAEVGEQPFTEGVLVPDDGTECGLYALTIAAGRAAVVPEFDQVVFNEAVGVVHGPVKTQFGYHLVEVTRRED